MARVTTLQKRALLVSLKTAFGHNLSAAVQVLMAEQWVHKIVVVPGGVTAVLRVSADDDLSSEAERLRFLMSTWALKGEVTVDVIEAPS